MAVRGASQRGEVLTVWGDVAESTRSVKQCDSAYQNTSEVCIQVNVSKMYVCFLN
jgi:hypothetical protein